MRDQILHIYTRVSTSVQEVEGTSLENQKNLGIKKSHELGLEHKVWNEGGQSSFSDDLDNRPQLVELLSEIDSGSIKHLFVYNTDRLSRNQRTWGLIRWKLQTNSVVLHTPSGKIDLSNPMDDLVMGMLSEISQYDNKLRTERSRQGRFYKVQQGNWRGGPTPFGYRNENKRLTVDDFESHWVKKMFKMYSEGQSIDQIRSKLNSSGVITRRGNPYWSLGSIRKILTNTLYIGFYNYTDKKIGETVRVQTPQLIDDVTFNDVQRKLKRIASRKHQINRTKHFYLLRDLMVCDHCGTKMSGKRDAKNHHHYFCPHKERQWVRESIPDEQKWVRGNRCSMIRSLNIDTVDRVVWETVQQTIKNSTTLRERFRKELLPKIIKDRERGQTTVVEFKKKIKRLKKELSEIDLTIANFETDVILKRVSGNPEIIRNNLNDEKTRIQNSCKETQRDFEMFLKQKSWSNWLEKYDKDLQRKSELSDLEKREYLSNIIEKISVTYHETKKVHSLNIQFTLPIVNDCLEFTNDNDHREGWTIEEGVNNVTVVDTFNKGRGRPKKNSMRV